MSRTPSEENPPVEEQVPRAEMTAEGGRLPPLSTPLVSEREEGVDDGDTHVDGTEQNAGDAVDAEVADVFDAQHESTAPGAGDDDEEEREGEEDGEADDMPDNVGSDVRLAPAEPVVYEALPHGRPSHDQAAESGEAAGTASRTRSAESQTLDSRDIDMREEDGEETDAAGADTAAAMSAEARQGMNPSQGIQADAGTDLPAEAEPDAPDEEADATEESGVIPAEASLAEARPPPSQAVAQTAVGSVEVHTTLLPMQCRTTLTLPVSRAVKTNASSNSTTGGGAVRPGESCWLLSARGLFEAMATRLCVHPQSFHMYRNGERVRFQHTLMLEVDRTSATTASPSGDSRAALQTASVGTVSALAAAGAFGVGCSRAEPLWLTVVFPAAGEAAQDDAPHDAVGSSGVPAHLATLQTGDVLERCLHVRKTKPVLLPQTLVEGRRQGLSFDEMIHQSYAYDRGVAGDEDVATVVAVLRAADATRKPFLGGYRVKHDPSRLLLHASTQLFMKDLNYSPLGDKAARVADMCSRQTQTYGISRSCQTAREGCVQTDSCLDGGPLALDNAHDYVVVARPYCSAAAVHELRVDKAIILQKMYRQWKARQTRRGLEEEETDKQHRAEERQRAEEAAQRARENRAHMRRADPHTAADFDRLKEELMRWRSEEAARLVRNTTLTPRERQNALLAVTKEEVRMLQELDHRRRLTLLEHRDQQFATQLARTAAEKVWGTSGVHVTTPETVRAGELRDLYTHLVNHNVPAEERLDALLHVKWTVKEFPSAAVSAELCQLIDREADLLHRGRREASLTGLRKRIDTLFRQFLEDPTFNPGIAPFTTSAAGRAKVRALGLEGKGQPVVVPTATSSSPPSPPAGSVGETGVPYGGYTAAKCASCSQQLRVATLRHERRQRTARETQETETETEAGAAAAVMGGSSRKGPFAQTEDGSGPATHRAPAATAV